MQIWQVDFCKSLIQPRQWDLLVCEPQGALLYEASCDQSEAGATWLGKQLQSLGTLPDTIQVFRPQCLNVLMVVGEHLGVRVEGTRRTGALKTILKDKSPLLVQLEKPAPQPLPDRLWGEQWRFATLPAGDVVELFRDRPLPYLEIPPDLEPLPLGLASTIPIPGIIIYGGRQSLLLARWLQENKPFAVNFIANEPGKSGGLVLESGLVDRWILVTFEDAEVARSASVYQERLGNAQGLHFLLVQPDDSGMTYTGFWLLQVEPLN